MQRITSSFTSVSWIPSEAISGIYKLGMALGMGHYDPPLPDRLGDLEELREADRFRFANELRVFIDVDDDGTIVDAGHLGHGHIGATVVSVAGAVATIPAVGFPDRVGEPEHGDGWVRFTQTAGGRTGVPFPRRVNRPPWVQVTSPSAWTTLALTLHADGRGEPEVLGASPFPRHWFYDDDGTLVRKSGLTDWKTWMAETFGEESPWGEGGDRPAVVAEVESALERVLSTVIMRGGSRPEIRRLGEGDQLTTQGEPGRELYLVLDGMLEVEVDGEVVAEVGPGAILGERAVLEDGARTSTLRTITPARIAVASADQVDRSALAELAAGHRREDAGVGSPSA